MKTTCNCRPARKPSTCHRYVKTSLWPLGAGAYTASDKHPALEKGLATWNELMIYRFFAHRYCMWTDHECCTIARHSCTSTRGETAWNVAHMRFLVVRTMNF